MQGSEERGRFDWRESGGTREQRVVSSSVETEFSEMDVNVEVGEVLDECSSLFFFFLSLFRASRRALPSVVFLLSHRAAMSNMMLLPPPGGGARQALTPGNVLSLLSTAIGGDGTSALISSTSAARADAERTLQNATDTAAPGFMLSLLEIIEAREGVAEVRGLK